MFKKVLLGGGVLVLGLLAVIATRPAEYHIERSLSMAAAPDVVYAQVNDLGKFSEWSPWQKLDPAMKSDISNPSTGVGASYHWTGNDQVGEGKMSITDSVANDKVVMDLAFLKPMESQAMVTVSMVPDADGSKVTWAMDGKNDFMGKAFALFADMDAMLGKDFSEGLANLKTVTEATAKKKAEEAAAAAAALAAQPAPTEGAPVDGSAAAAPAGTEAAPAAAGQGAPAAMPAGGEAAPAAH